MPKSLIDEPPLLVLPSLAAAIGLSEAIFLQQLHYWLDTAGHIQDDGQRWIFNSYEAWSTQFPWWNIGTIRRIVATLRDAGIIHTTTRYNKIAIDNTLWYTIDYTALENRTNPPPEPAAPPPAEDPAPSVETDRPSAGTNRPRAQNAQTTRAKLADHARKMRTPIPETTTETTTETTPTVVVVDSDPHQKPISLPEKTRARPRTRDPRPPAHPEPSDTYHQANTHPAALDAALQHAEILDPATRASILAANPDLTVEQIFAWDAYRTRANATNGRKLGPGALVSLLRSAATPPRSTTDPETAARWLITNGHLAAPEPDPSVSVRVRPLGSAIDDAGDPIQPQSAQLPNQPILADPAALNLWQPVITEISMTHRHAYDNWLRHAIPTHYDPDTGHFIVTAHNPFAQDWLSQRMNGMLTQRLQRLAGRSIHLTFQLPNTPGPAP